MKHIKQCLLALVLLLGQSAQAAGDDFLEPEQAFKLSVKALDERTVEVVYAIAPGYYMYREKFHAAGHGARVGEPQMPVGKKKFDETFQKTVEVYHDELRVRLPVSEAAGTFKLAITGQGCADKGLCYPPLTQEAEVNLSSGSARVLGAVDAPSPAAPAVATTPAQTGEEGRLNAALQSGRFWSVVGVFFVAGLLLSFTPCVLPMLPILSSIIVGSGGQVTRSRGLLLATAYSLGMALVYTALGVAAGLAGEGLAAALQKPWVLISFALALVLFSLSMFGVYELQLPGVLTGSLSDASQKLPAGRFFSVFAMGGISALIVSPCVAAPLAGALVFISQTRDVFLGGGALFALAAGMSVPLLLLGASAGTLLPRAGAWMDGVKHFFGLLLLAVALWIASPVLPSTIVQALWGALLIGGAALLGLFDATTAPSPGRGLCKTLAVIALVAGLAQLVGAAAGGTDPLRPLAGVGISSGKAAAEAGAHLRFQTVKSVAELDAAVATAGRPVMLDFYADWCVSCKEMERFTFADSRVQQRLAGALLLKADVTANNADDKALLKRFNLFGPPGTIFFDGQGKQSDVRIVGYQDAERFLSTLSSAGL